MSGDKEQGPPDWIDVAEVGYGKPPKQHQFKKGVSGNPNGRPRKHANEVDLRAMLLKEFFEPVTVIVDGKKQKIPWLQILIKQQRNAILKGAPVPRLFIDFFRKLLDESSSPTNPSFADFLEDLRSDKYKPIIKPDEPGPENPIL